MASKIIAGKQMTICWHVDDPKISHLDPKQVTKVIEWLESIFDKMRTS